MTRLDLTPFFRNSIGIDRLSRMIDQVEHVNATSYPPYNIVATGDDKYEIEMAIAGFTQNEITVSTQNGELVILGEKNETEADTRNYLHHGISARKFRRVFNLADYVEVQSAVVKDGILTVYLERIIPDALKPKQIEVKVA
jgi:molecular chaperone IbpA